jgi:hypothetical protein
MKVALGICLFSPQLSKMPEWEGTKGYLEGEALGASQPSEAGVDLALQ